MKSVQDWNPIWYTIDAFSDKKPLNLYHKEQEAAKEEPGDVKNLHVLARAKYFKDEKKEAFPCLLRISADDYYKLYVNGVFVGQGPAPAYPEHYYYNEIDLTPYLKDGENIVAVHLYYQGLVNRVWNSGDNRLGIAAEFLGEGSLIWKYQICKAYSGAVIGYDTQFSEDFDSRLWEEDWNQTDYDDSTWTPMVRAKWADYRLEKQPTVPLSVERRAVEKLVEIQPGIWFADVGTEITGALLLRASGKAGQKIRIFCGEEEEESGRVRHAMRCNCDYSETWTLADGVCTLEPYDYKGFHYANLILEPGIKLLDVEVQIRHYPMDEECCVLKSSAAYTQQIFEICKNGVRCGTQEGYLDCPTREKGQYLGDAVVTANSQVWLTGKTDMLRKCITQFAQSAAVCPGLMGVAPGSFMQEVADFSLLWSQLVLMEYRFSGDKAFLGACYPTAKGIIEHFKQYAREDGLLEQVKDKWNLVDWPENLRDGYDFVLSRPIVAPGCHNVINALYIGAVKTLEEIGRILDKTDCSGRWEELREAYINTFYDPKTKLFTDTKESRHSAVHSNAYALYFDLVPDEAVESVAGFLSEGDFRCGVMLSYYILKALANHGYYQETYRLLTNTGEHGWVNMLREGASTCFEAWGKEQKWNTSLCHPWASAPIPVLIECIAGFCPDPEAEEGFVFDPHIPDEEEGFELTVLFQGKRYRIIKEGAAARLVRIA